MPEQINLGGLVLDLADFEKEGLRAYIAGGSGSGKGYLLGVFGEELIDLGIPCVMLDAEHELWTFKEVGAVVVGGEEQDLPFVDRPEAIDAVLKFCLSTGTPVVFDIHQEAQADEVRAGQIGDRIMRALWELLDQTEWRRRCAFLCTEAHIFAPEVYDKGQRPPRTMRQMFSRGRKRGLMSFVECQRTAAIQNGVIELANERFIGRMDGAADLRPLRAHLPSPKGRGERTLAEMKELDPGWFIRSGDVDPFHVRERRVTHGGGTPPPGETIQITGVGERAFGELEAAIRQAMIAANETTVEEARERETVERGRRGGKTAGLRQITQLEAQATELRGQLERAQQETADVAAELTERDRELAEAQQALGRYETFGHALLDLLGGEVPVAGVSANGLSEARVVELVREHAPSGNGTGPALAPVEKLRKGYLERAARKLFETMDGLDAPSRDVLLWLISKGTFQTINAVCVAIEHQRNEAARKRVIAALAPLTSAGLVVTGGSGGMGRKADVDGWVRKGLTANDPTDDEVAEVRDRALSMLAVAEGAHV